MDSASNTANYYEEQISVDLNKMIFLEKKCVNICVKIN